MKFKSTHANINAILNQFNDVLPNLEITQEQGHSPNFLGITIDAI